MSLPEITKFSFDTADGVWRCPDGPFDADLAIRDEGGAPSQEDYAFLSKAMREFDSIPPKIHKYVSAFCPAPDIGEGTPHDFVELTVKNWRETKVLSVYLNYQNDTYGLWSVDFTWDEYNKWAPVAFRRENW